MNSGRFIPEVNVLGSGGGGLGHEATKSFDHQARWSFNGQLLAGKGTWVYQTLKWDLSENELERQSFHSSTVRTGFAFQHSGQPFLMKVDIRGKLDSWNDRMKAKFAFGGSAGDGKKANRVTTLLDFDDYKSYERRLDEIAEGLPRSMEMANVGEVPVEIPDTIPATTFSRAPEQPMQMHSDHPKFQTSHRPWIPITGLAGGAMEQSSFTSQIEPLRSSVPGIPTLEDLRTLLQTSSQSTKVPEGILPGLETITESSSVETLVDPEETRASAESNRVELPHQHSTKQNGNQPELGVTSQDIVRREEKKHEQQVLHAAELLQIPMVLAILQLLSSLLSSLGYMPKSKQSQDEIQKKDEELQTSENPVRRTLKEDDTVQGAQA